MSAVAPVVDSPLRPSGLACIGDAPWGSHLCQFYERAEDLVETLVPFFRAGLEANERCLWITTQPFAAEAARAALAEVVPDLARRIASRQIDILDHEVFYLRSGALDADRVVAQWLDAEADARARGFSGLRLSGDTFWVERTAWSAFAAYEARVHAAFAGHNILALCSYPLAHCGANDLLDVLRNHRTALVKSRGRWQAVGSATLLLEATGRREHAKSSPRDLAKAGSGGAHRVCLFQDDYPATRVAEHLAAALSAGHPAVVFATRAHEEAIGRALASRGVDVAACVASGRLVTGDAEAMAAAVAHGQPPEIAVRARFGAVVEDTLARREPVRAYGEIVDVLARDGRSDLALLLERWWNDLVQTEPIELLCGYSTRSFVDAASVPTFRAICAEHTDVEPSGGAGGADGRVVAELHQTAAALEGEASRRRAIEEQRDGLHRAERDARFRAEALARHLASLQRFTSALSKAAGLDDIVRVVLTELQSAFPSTIVVLVVPTEDGERLELLGQTNVAAENVERFRSFSIDEALPIAVAFRTAQPVWLASREAIEARFPLAAKAAPSARAIACAPLLAGGRKLGAVGLQLLDGGEATTSERALLDDFGSQIAVALDRARSYERAERERLRAEAANRAKDEFLAMLGHELRNPLSPILTAVQLMEHRANDVLAKERRIVERQVRHMVRLVDDLLDVSRIARGKVGLERAPVEIADVVATAIELAKPLLEERSHQLTTDVPTSGLVVQGDAARLSQILANLLHNAAKYTPAHGDIAIRAALCDGRVVLTVEDDGVGIDPDLLPRIFELFVQAPQSSERKVGGLGLGLSIARSLVELHGGTIRAESAGIGHGSRFVVELDRFDARAGACDAEPEPSAQAPLAIGRVLVVDDNVDAASLLAEALEGFGHQVRVAHDGPSALAAAAELGPDLALIDIGLPAMDGYEVGRRLVSALAAAPPRLVAVTGYGQDADRRRSSDAGFAEHLVKPVTLERLQAVVSELLGRA